MKTSDDFDDCSCNLLQSSDSSLILSINLLGVLLFWHLGTRMESLNLMRLFILSHWSSSRIRVEMWSNFWLAVPDEQQRWWMPEAEWCDKNNDSWNSWWTVLTFGETIEIVQVEARLMKNHWIRSWIDALKDVSLTENEDAFMPGIISKCIHSISPYIYSFNWWNNYFTTDLNAIGIYVAGIECSKA